MKKDKKKHRDSLGKFVLPFYIMKLTLRVSPAYLMVTAGIAVVSAVSPILSTWLTQQILAGLLAGEERRTLFVLVMCLVGANLICTGINRYLAVKQGVYSERFRDDFNAMWAGRLCPWTILCWRIPGSWI